MKKLKTFFTFVLVLSIFLQPMPAHAATIFDGRVYLKPSIYEWLEDYRIQRDTIGSPEEWMKTGHYYYELIDRLHNYITIRKIEPGAVQNGRLAIPEWIDNYRVLGVGMLERPPVSFEWPDVCVMDNMETVEEIVLPERVEIIGEGAFYGCTNLKKISMPKSLVKVGSASLYGCTELKNIEFPEGVYVEKGAFNGKGDSFCNPQKVVLYSDCVIELGLHSKFRFPKTEQTELYILRHEKDIFHLEFIPGYIDKAYVDKKLSEFRITVPVDEYDKVMDYCVTNLIMNGKNTKFTFVGGLEDLMEMCPVKKLYTVKGAKSIKEAKRFRIPCYWKTVGKAQKVKAKKKNKLYKASWKKIKTTINKYECFDFNLDPKKDKWITKQRPAETLYKVYGKKKKNGNYKLIQTTKKRSITSKYPYIKAVAVKEWD